MSDIGKRAFQELRLQAGLGGESFWKWCEDHGIERITAYRWNKGLSDPSAAYLADLANLGFDVQYILTGKPAATHAEWKPETKLGVRWLWKCSNCGGLVKDWQPQRCPHCGAYMNFFKKEVQE